MPQLSLFLRLGLATAVSLALLVWMPYHRENGDEEVIRSTLKVARTQSVVIDKLSQAVKEREHLNKDTILNTEAASATLKADEAKTEKRALLIAHVINPIPPGHGLHLDQDITFATLANAYEEARRRDIDVVQYTAEFFDDPRAQKPSSFQSTPDLKRHAHQVYEMASRGVAFRKLPLIADILGVLYEATEQFSTKNYCLPNRTLTSPVSYERILLVYTNTDIAVQKNFYSVVKQYAVPGTDAFVINRVETPAKDQSGRLYGLGDLNTLYTFGKEKPQLHAGYDCFVWDRRVTPFLRLYTRGLFVGYPPVGKHLRDAMSCILGHAFREVRGKKHTFHVGDRNGGWSKFPEFEHFNRKAARRSEADFQSAIRAQPFKNRNLACSAARRAALHSNDIKKRMLDSLLCSAQEELRLRSFLRWDRPGSEWPPTPL